MRAAFFQSEGEDVDENSTCAIARSTHQKSSLLETYKKADMQICTCSSIASMRSPSAPSSGVHTYSGTSGAEDSFAEVCFTVPKDEISRRSRLLN